MTESKQIDYFGKSSVISSDAFDALFNLPDALPYPRLVGIVHPIIKHFDALDDDILTPIIKNDFQKNEDGMRYAKFTKAFKKVSIHR